MLQIRQDLRFKWLAVWLHIDHAHQVVGLLRLAFIEVDLLKANVITEKGARFHGGDVQPNHVVRLKVYIPFPQLLNFEIVRYEIGELL